MSTENYHICSQPEMVSALFSALAGWQEGCPARKCTCATAEKSSLPVENCEKPDYQLMQVNQGPDLQNILRFIIKLSEVYRKTDF